MRNDSDKKKFLRESSLSDGKLGKPPRPGDTFDTDKKTAKIEPFLKPSLPNQRGHSKNSRNGEETQSAAAAILKRPAKLAPA